MVMKSTPWAAWAAMADSMSSWVSCSTDFSTIIEYTGTVPTGTVARAMRKARISSRSPPVERSITVSAPHSTARHSLASSASLHELTGEAPMLALILVLTPRPMPTGSSRAAPPSPAARRILLAGITSRPAASSSRMNSAVTCSRSATRRISAVIVPARACWY